MAVGEIHSADLLSTMVPEGLPANQAYSVAQELVGYEKVEAQGLLGTVFGPVGTLRAPSNLDGSDWGADVVGPPENVIE